MSHKLVDMITRTKWTPIILQEKQFWSTLDLLENKRTLKSSLCLSRSFIRALAQNRWHSPHRLSQRATRQPAMGKDFLGRHFSSNKLSEDLELTFPTVSMWCLCELKLCWPNPRVTAVSPTRDLCPYATFKKYHSFLFSPSASRFLYAALKSTSSLSCHPSASQSRCFQQILSSLLWLPVWPWGAVKHPGLLTERGHRW